MQDKILSYRESVLRKKAKDVSQQENVSNLVKRMKTMIVDADGAGLAAPQIGVSKRVIAVNTQDEIFVLLNPIIIKKSKEMIVSREGCLSVEGIWLDVHRSSKIKVKALTSEKEEIEITAEGAVSVILQHEIDHLDGILFIDRVSFFQRNKVFINYFLKKFIYGSKNSCSIFKK